MNLIDITDFTLSQLQIYSKLRDNAFTKDNSFIADSPKVVNLLLQTDIEVKSILATPEYYHDNKSLLENRGEITFYCASKELMQTLIGHKLHHNVMMHGIRPASFSLDELDDKIIMLDTITSTENVVSIARSAAAFGVNSYLTPATSPHPYSRRALRVSMGHVSMLKTHIYQDICETIKALQNRGYKIFAAEVSENSIMLPQVKVPQKWVILMGHEGKGIAQNILDVCDDVVTIPMQSGVNSFNVGVAASLMMYQFTNA